MIFNPAFDLLLKRTEFVGEKFTVSARRRGRQFGPTLGDPRGEVRIIKPRSIKLERVITGPN